MALRILIRNEPRSIALTTDSHALIFQNQNTVVSTAVYEQKYVASFSRVTQFDFTSYRPLRPHGILGTLGLINIGEDIFICVITHATPVACVRPGENIQRIAAVEFFCLNSERFNYDLSQDLSNYDPYDPYEEAHEVKDFASSDYKDNGMQHPCQALKAVLGDGTFYYSTDIDLTNRLQNRVIEDSAFADLDTLDHSFLWNGYMIRPLIQFRSRLALEDRRALDASHILTSSIRGYASSITIPSASSPFKNIQSRLPSTLTLVSRLSCRRAGTRFNSRGLDDDGNVANFVETETVYYLPDGRCFSYAQTRGSVPLFWEQASGLLPQQQKIQITRSLEATQPAFDKHFEDLELRYGAIHVINLLSRGKTGEAELSSHYANHVQRCSINRGLQGAQYLERALLLATHFDFHAETKGPNGYEAAKTIRQHIQDQSDGFAFFLYDNSVRYHKGASTNGVILQQEGVFRTNCLDCLDRTNLVQGIISQMSLELFFNQERASSSYDFWSRHSTLWADNGDALSRIYAGTGALKSSFTRHGKMSIAGALADARKSATRLYMNNFADKARQTLIDTLLGRMVNQSPVQLFDPINDIVAAELLSRASEYSTSMDISIWVGTFNLNGKRYSPKEDLARWFWPHRVESRLLYDIVVVGFQEIVELSPEHILSTDPARRQEWESAVLSALNGETENSDRQNYVLLRSGQLVGAALMLFVRSSNLDLVKNVEGTLKKTGLSGMAGNKGAVAIRIEFANTSMCFVTAHLAAGFANYDERNQDYRTIDGGLRFQRGRAIQDHETVIWLGDFNYRIGLSNERVRQLIDSGDLTGLFKHDQLNLQMVAGHSFPFYNESRIHFLPTYKYDNGTDEYDTSEKARIPAWCDRILWKAKNLKQINYDTAPFHFSDHRPVFGLFQCRVLRNDETAKQKLIEGIYRKRQSSITGMDNKITVGDQESSICGTNGHLDELNAAHTKNFQQKWWLIGDVHVRSNLSDIHGDSRPNPERPSNPFAQSEAEEWIPRNDPGKHSPYSLMIKTTNQPATIVRKPAPPVPKKPIGLATTPPPRPAKVTDNVILHGGDNANFAPLRNLERDESLMSVHSSTTQIGQAQEDRLQGRVYEAFGSSTASHIQPQDSLIDLQEENLEILPLKPLRPQ